ncbi:MAG: class I SAM-dependent methyltransferase [Candidatus Dormibacteria bacterium]
MAAETAARFIAAMPLSERYAPSDLSVFSSSEAQRFLGGGCDDPRASPMLAWELLYRLEPRLYDRLASAERIHPAILDWLPRRSGHVVEVGAGTGRLTLELVARCDQLIAIEPAAPLRTILSERLAALGISAGVRIVDGWCDALPVPDASADLVIACSMLTPDRAHGGDAGLAEMERVCAPHGRVVIIWPNHLRWLRQRGFSYKSFPGEMNMEFPSVEEAVELAGIFYPDAVSEIRQRRRRRVPYEVLGVNPPRDVAYKDIRG